MDVPHLTIYFFGRRGDVSSYTKYFLSRNRTSKLFEKKKQISCEIHSQ